MKITGQELGPFSPVSDELVLAAIQRAQRHVTKVRLLLVFAGPSAWGSAATSTAPSSSGSAAFSGSSATGTMRRASGIQEPLGPLHLLPLGSGLA